MILNKRQETDDTIRMISLNLRSASVAYNYIHASNYNEDNSHIRYKEAVYSHSYIGIILGSVFSAIVAIVIILCIILLSRRRRKRNKARIRWSRSLAEKGNESDRHLRQISQRRQESISDGHVSINSHDGHSTTSSLVVECIDQQPGQSEKMKAVDEIISDDCHSNKSKTGIDNDSDIDRHSITSILDEAESIPSIPPSSHPPVSILTSTSARRSTSSSLSISNPNPAMNIVSPPQSIYRPPRESAETVMGTFDRPPWSRNSRFQEFF